MDYIKEIYNTISIVNNILDEIKIPHLLGNTDFIVNEMSMESWLKIDLVDKGQNKVPLSFTFTLSGLEVRLDRVTEAIDWSDNHLKESRNSVKSILKNIFINHILVEYHGSSITIISLFGQDGKCTNQFKYYEGFSLKRKKEYRLYFPVFDTELI